MSPAEMHAKIADRVYAPYWGGAPAWVLDRLKVEFRNEWRRKVRLVENIRVYRFVRP